MGGISENSPPLPEDPMLRGVAIDMERMGRLAEIVDERWGFVYISSQLCTVAGVEPRNAGLYYGLSWITRELQHPEVWGTDPESQRWWWRAFVPYMRSMLEPGTPLLDEVFGPAAEAATRVEPREMPPVWGARSRFSRPDVGYTALQHLLGIRLARPDGTFAGVLQVSWPGLPGAVTGLLSRGDVAMYERMARLAEPARRPGAILFADLESSGPLARRLSTSAYFTLIRNTTTVIDDAVAARGGIVGKHAGDGASAFFLVADASGSESAAARAAIEAARAIREASTSVGAADSPVAVNIGIHWGDKLVMGQVVTGGRLEVTALGDEVNETARVQDTARGGAILATKDLIERLEADDAVAVGVDLANTTYCPLAERTGASAKAIRDAGSLAVTEL